MFAHPSWTEDRAASYERLEFLGDSVLGFVVARHLFERYPEFSEGRLSQIRAHVVSRRSCAVVALELGLDRMLAERQELSEDLRRSSNVLAAVVESAIAGLYLEHGLEAIAPALVEAFAGRIEEALERPADYKTQLQEMLARSGRTVSYEVLATEGPAHDRHFRCAALVAGEEMGTGEGRTKKDAEQAAAQEALARVAGESGSAE